MSKTKYVALHRVVLSDKDGNPDVKERTSEPFTLTEAQAAELTALSAVRKARKGDFNGADPALFDHDGDGDAGGSLPDLKAHHRGGGKWDVVDSKDAVVSGDELFDSKADAEAWIAKRPNGKSDVT